MKVAIVSFTTLLFAWPPLGITNGVALSHRVVPQQKSQQGVTVSEKEKELKQALADIRDAIKEYKSLCDTGQVGPLDRRKDDQCYPPNLEALVEGFRPADKKYFIQFLKKIPVDPITGNADWGLRSAQDEKWSAVWGGQNVFEVFSKSNGIAADGSRYRDW